MHHHVVSDLTLDDGTAALRLASGDARAALVVVPACGMVGISFTHDGAELLGQRHGLDAYRTHGSTLGVPLLHPWANRLGADGYTVGGLRIDLADNPLVHRDAGGLPIHGMLAAAPDWHLTTRGADQRAAHVGARYVWGTRPGELDGFPFPHTLDLDIRLAADGPDAYAATWRLAVTATGNVAVPVASGWHPYLQLPGVNRADWRVRLPGGEHATLDDRSLPTGATSAASTDTTPLTPLGDRTYDDLFVGVPAGAAAVVAGGGRRVELHWDRGWRVAVVYAPDDDDVIAFEPMTAATNPFDGPFPATLLRPGDTAVATFRLRVAAE